MKRVLALAVILGLTMGTLLVLVRSVSAEPQRRSAPNATLTGVVIGPDDKPVPRAAVTYQSSAGDTPHATHTDAHGRFTIHKLRSDNYDVRASANGIFSEWKKNVLVHSGQTKEITLQLIYAKEMPKSASKPKKH